MLILAFLLLASGQVFLHAGDSNAVLRLGFSSAVFASVNENDAKAAMKIWAQTIAKERGAAIPADSQVLSGDTAIANAVRNKLVDAVTITAEEYWILGGQFMSTNAIVGLNSGLATEEYLLLVRHDSGFGQIADLRGHKLVFCHNVRHSLAPVWFETLLLKAGFGQTQLFCGRVIQSTKLTETVLPVFFGQIDACVATRRGFQTMTELNPQLGQQLKILASSVPMVPSAFLFRADYSDPARDKVIAQIEHVHSTVADQQVLTLFQCDGLQVRPISDLDTALELLETHASLLQVAKHAAPGPSGVPLTDARSDKP